MSIVDAFKAITDPNGMISNKPNPTESYGNAILATAEAMVALHAADALTFELAKTYSLSVLKCQITPGLFARTPKGCPYSTDQESQDDYIGLGVIARFYGPSIARDILAWGRSHYYVPLYRLRFIRFRYYYANAGQDDHDLHAWIGRFPAVIAHLEWAAGIKPCLLRRFAWFLSVAFCGTSQDGWILSALMCFRIEQMGWIEQFGASVRRKRFKRSPYCGQLGKVFQVYFGWAHPLSLWSWE